MAAKPTLIESERGMRTSASVLRNGVGVKARHAATFDSRPTRASRSPRIAPAALICRARLGSPIKAWDIWGTRKAASKRVAKWPGDRLAVHQYKTSEM